MKNQVKSLRLAAMILLFFSACGPRAKLQPEFDGVQVQTLALLPISVPEETRSERRRFLRSAFESELAARGYRLLDESLVLTVCRDSACANRSQLAAAYPISAFVDVKISGIERNNFVLGFYNAIEGSLNASTPTGKVIAEVEFTESKRGGLVFDSGQVIQAIKEQYENYGDWNFNSLASGFAEEIVAQLPSISSAAARTLGSAPVIQNVSVKPRRGMVDEVCVSGTPGLRALLFLNKRMTNLREVSSGKYCGAYRIPPKYAPEKMLIVELRSAFGAAVREVFDVDSIRAGATGLRSRVTESM